ncbi:MAG: hypothetical protein NT062_28150 [Proteobacteria bacterium]|nr:hypothetical protein [Pseudomonadota bacterium]
MVRSAGFVGLVVALVVSLATPARADELDRVTKFGFRIGYGAVPLATSEARSTSLGLGIEHPAFGATRVFGEWEWLWIDEWNDANAEASMRAPLHGSGQRATLGLRHALGVLHVNEMIRMFVDSEVGGGAMLASEDRMGVSAVPVGIAGLRLGYDFRRGSSSARVLEAEFMLRAVIVPTGYGLMFGVGMLWGD